MDLKFGMLELWMGIDFGVSILCSWTGLLACRRVGV